MDKMFQLQLLLFFAFALGTVSKMNQEDHSSGCTSRFLLPDRPFIVIWNHPSSRCEAHGINLNLTAWGIVENKKDAFAGEEIIIYYGLGHWPALDRQGHVKSNGGVPQRGNLRYHLETVKNQVLSDTKPGFNGVGVIDMESWRPIFEHNFDSLYAYQKVSIDIVKARYPHLNATAVKHEAAREFDAAARLFFEGTLNVTNSHRQDGHWGYYGFPRNWGGNVNDKLAYLWRNSKGLFPRIYMRSTLPHASVKKYIHGQMKETLRVWAKYSTPDTMILPYSVCQDGGSIFFSKENLTLAIGLPAEMGAAGVVLWGSSNIFHTPNECQLLQKYVNTVLGPYVKNLTNFFSDCSVFYCSAHGRCVEKNMEVYVQQCRREYNQQQCRIKDKLFREELMVEELINDGLFDARFPDAPNPYRNYVCRCLPGWGGNHCEKKIETCDV